MDVINKYPCAPLVTIDWSQATSHPTPSLSSQILGALETQGFFYLKNVHGYSAQRLEEATKWFFGKSLPFKMQVARQGISAFFHFESF